MRRRIKKLINNNEKKVIFSNFFSLSLLNVINYLFPLIMVPYLIRVIGVEKYGIHSFSLSFLQYFLLLVNFGFQYTATRELTLNKNNKENINEIFSVHIAAQVIIAFISFLILILAILIIPAIANEKLLFIYGAGIFIGQALMPLWLFQGLEKMEFMTIIVTIPKFIILILTFLFVNTPADYLLVNAFYSIGYILSGITSIFLAFYFFKLKLVYPTMNQIFSQFRSGWQLFSSTIGMNLYRETNIVLLGFLAPYQFVGYYSAADKIIRVVKSFLTPISQALFPYFGRKLDKNEENYSNNIKRFYKYGIIYSIILLFLSGIIFFSATTIIKHFLGLDMLRTSIIIKIMSISIVFGGMNYYFGILGLINLRYDRYFTRIVWITGMLSIILCLILIPPFKDLGAAVVTNISEALLFILILIKLRKLSNE